ncbi:Immunoglobulin G-binding protein A [Colletotrichum orbiculare MAFF 240422]|uniref:Immunoglobulin G-binding protein A n=1 Tax=Colletotrichum orbiculare (strain 104-T / ATCC 96160 / CBS 514.97 / LARS 414 / MAFF 240422) TaxID=1213857 RepID=A0A484FP99_COLOR|nr:Immunoglobulin G-binding protein A [Colletotrichum orbiculare MAFF 240422]
MTATDLKSCLSWLLHIVHPGFGSYTVVGGDNLNDIAKDFGTTSTQLAAMNGIPDPDSIKPGNNLVVPCV